MPSSNAVEHSCNFCEQRRPCTELYRIGGHDVVRCNECDLVFVAEPMTPVETADLYSREYFEGSIPDGYADYRASEDTLRQQARRVLRRVRRHQPSGTLLEVGCAYGFFLSEAQAFFRTKGVEISSFAAQQARDRGLDVVTGDLQELDFSQTEFSAACLFDCIEHLTDPLTYLRKIHSVLSPNGILALTTGDVGSLYARISGRRWRLMTPPQHLFYFSRATLLKMLTKAGFEAVEISYPWKLVPLRLVLYQRSPQVKAALGALGRLPLGLYVNLFDAVFVIARKK